MKCSILFLLAMIGTVLATPPGTWWNPCSTTTKYPMTINDVTMPIPVEALTINISWSGNLSVTVPAGSMKWVLAFDGIPFYSTTDDLCKFNVPCPVSPNPDVTFTVTKTFPRAPFKGTISGTVTGTLTDGTVLSCVALTGVPVTPPP